jgi:hypothetical protein
MAGVGIKPGKYIADYQQNPKPGPTVLGGFVNKELKLWRVPGA